MLIVVVIGSFSRNLRVSPTSYGSTGETATWYCAGEAVNAHADPYRVEPLRSCEARHGHGGGYPWVEPAPLPGYTLAAFAVLARVPYAMAQAVWLYVLIAAVVSTALLLAKLTRTPVLLPLLCLALVDGYLNVNFRELPPIAVAALVASAALGTSGRYTAAAVCGAIAMIEPHVGLPGCIAMFLWWPRTRVTFALAGCILAAISLVTIGVLGNLEYFREVLPVHAAAEITAVDQYSLTRLLHISGFSNATALRLGGASYIVMTLLGVASARRLATAAESEALIALYPPAVAILGGAFVHDLQMAAALPAAIIIAAWTRAPLPLRLFSLAAVAFTWQAASWSQSLQNAALAASSITAVALLAMRAQPVATRWPRALLVAIACLGVALAVQRLPQRTLGPPTRLAPLASAPGDNASANWAARVTRNVAYSTPTVRDVAEKIPVWLGLIALTSIGVLCPRYLASDVNGRSVRAN